MKRPALTRRGFLQGASLATASSATGMPPPRQAGPDAGARRRYRTQFDHELLAESQSEHPTVVANDGRQVLVLPGGDTVAALSWGVPAPVVRLWRDRRLVAAHRLAGGLVVSKNSICLRSCGLQSPLR